MLTSADISDLLGLTASRDRQAFSRLYDATSSKLYGIVLRILKRRDVADEVLQEIYVKVWEKAATFDRRISSPITWMCAIARNQALDEVRRKRPDSLEDHPAYLETESEEELPLDAILRGEEGKRLMNCLLKLEQERAQMVVLAYCNGYSREELGARYGQPVNTIKTWLRRSLMQLRTCLSS